MLKNTLQGNPVYINGYPAPETLSLATLWLGINELRKKAKGDGHTWAAERYWQEQEFLDSLESKPVRGSGYDPYNHVGETA